MSTQADSPARRALAGPLLVAGEELSPLDAPFRVAQLLARRDAIEAHVLAIGRPLSLPASVFGGADREAWQEARKQQQLAAVRQRLHRTVGQTAHFSVSVGSGSPHL